MSIRRTLYSGAAAITFAVLVVGASTPVRAQQSPPVSIGDTDLGGVVTGPNGPEAGVWVIAETADLPTKMVKIVVTDDQGRYVMPDLPKANYTVWARGYGLVDSAEGHHHARQDREHHRGEGAERGRGSGILSAGLLAVAHQNSGHDRIPRHRQRRQRHQSEHQVADPVPARVQDRRLLPLPRHRHQGDPHAVAGARRLQVERGCLASPHPVRSGKQGHGRDDRAVRHLPRRQDARRLDRRDRRPANCRPQSRRGRKGSSATS